MRPVFSTIALYVVLTGGAMGQVRGHLVMSGAERSDVLVSLESHSGQIVDQTLTGARGQFLLEGVTVTSISSANPMYIVVDEEGYKPYRQMILQSDLRSGGQSFTIYLEAEAPDPAAPRDQAETVGVGQLRTSVPRAAREAFERASDESAIGDYPQAIEHLEFAVDVFPEYYDAWVDLGALYDRIDQPERSIAAFLNAAEVNPGGSVAHLNLGALLYQQGERASADGNAMSLSAFSIARQWLEKAVQLDPTSSAAGFYLGATLYRLEYYDAAEEWLRRAVSMDGGHAAGARSMLINVYARQHRYQAALDEAVTFLDEYPEAPERETIERVKTQLEAALGI